MILAAIGVCLTFQTIICAPVEEDNILLKKRELEGLLPLTDIISNVENSLIKEAYSAGSVQELGKLRIGRDIDSDNLSETPKTQLSIITVKINSSELENVKDSVKDDKVKLDSLENKTGEDFELDDKKTEITNNTKPQIKYENIKKEKEKILVNTVAEIEVNPAIFVSRS